MYGAALATIPDGVDGRAALDDVKRRVAGADGPAPGSAEARVPYLQSEHFLVRFLIARQWNVDKACAMLRDHYKWLADTKMEALLEDPFPEEPVIKRYYPQAYHGCDKTGRPIYIERPGAIDMRRLLQTTTADRLIQYIAASCERHIRRRLPACSLRSGKIIDKSVTIVDLDGLGFSLVSHSIARSTVKKTINVLQNHYPEVNGRTIIINAPKVFSIAWSFMKPMLDDKTVAKISIFGTDREAYREALLDIIDADQLPSFCGGTCVCDGNDPMSCMMSVKGPWADEQVQKVLDSVPLEQIMTPGGCRVMQEQEAAAAAAAAATAVASEAAGAGEVPPIAATVPEAAGAAEMPLPADVVPEAAGAAEAPADAAEAPAPAVPSAAAMAAFATAAEEALEGEEEPTDLPPLPVPPGSVASNELREAEMECMLLEDEYRQHEEVHMATLSDWVNEYNTLSSEVGRHVIERAQGYYDSLSLWQQAVQEYAQKHDDLDHTNARLDEAVRDLSKAEAAFCASSADVPGWLSDEAWAELAPLPSEQGDDEQSMSPPSQQLAAEGPRLMRTLRLSALADIVASLQWRRDACKSQLNAMNREVEDSRRRYDQEDALHRSGSWNSSMTRAAPFYEKRLLHETKVESQIKVLRSLERRLQQARQVAAALEKKEGLHSFNGVKLLRSRSRQPDEMSLVSFQIKGAEPAEDEYRDEFLSCYGSDVDEDREP